MPAEILAPGTGAADSSDVVIASGSQLTVALKDAAGPNSLAGASVKIRIKDDAGQYFDVDTLDAFKPAVVITGAGTYRFSRLAGGPSVGVFSG